MADEDLAALFPNLASSLENWDGQPPSPNDPLATAPDHAGVTDEQIEAELRRMGALRAPLSPLVSGQQQPPTPEFYNNRGRAVPPGGRATVEPPQEPEPLPEEPETPDPATSTAIDGEVPGIPEEEGEEPPVAPPPPPIPPAAREQVSIAGRDYDRAQLEAWAQFDSLVGTDAELRSLIQEHLQRRSTGQPAIPTASDPLAPTGLPPLPELPPHYADDETIKGLYDVVRAQQEILDRTVRESRQALNTASSQAQRTYVDITKGAMSEFAASRKLDEPTMNSIMKTIVQSGLANTYMRGVDPITGESTTDPRTGQPDPYQAIMRAMDVAYYMVPETRQAEIDRGIQERVNRAQKDATRRQKLAGVSGAAGSVPRQQQLPTEPRDRYDAMVEEMRQMQAGSWVGDGN
jgi:hypothetical protein